MSCVTPVGEDSWKPVPGFHQTEPDEPFFPLLVLLSVLLLKETAAERMTVWVDPENHTTHHLPSISLRENTFLSPSLVSPSSIWCVHQGRWGPEMCFIISSYSFTFMFPRIPYISPGTALTSRDNPPSNRDPLNVPLHLVYKTGTQVFAIFVFWLSPMVGGSSRARAQTRNNSSNQNRSSDNTRSLTCCATREL